MELISKREDGTFVILYNDLPYHVIEGDEPFWSLAVEKAVEMGEDLSIEPPAPEPAKNTYLSKIELWKRLSDAEADKLDIALSKESVRLRRIFEAAQSLDSNDSNYPALKDVIVKALGEKRATIVLEPEI